MKINKLKRYAILLNGLDKLECLNLKMAGYPDSLNFRAALMEGINDINVGVGLQEEDL